MYYIKVLLFRELRVSFKSPRSTSYIKNPVIPRKSIHMKNGNTMYMLYTLLKVCLCLKF